MKEWTTKEIVKDSNWQNVRQSLLGKWKNESEECCKKLLEYLNKENNERSRDERLIILRNYLLSTPFRSGIIKGSNSVKEIVMNELNERKDKNLLEVKIIKNK